MRKYGKKTQKKVGKAMHEFKEGKLKSGRSGKKVKNPRQAIAIGLSEARKEGDKVPAAPRRKKTAKKARTAAKKTSAKKRTAAKRKTTKKKASTRKRSTSQHTRHLDRAA